MKKLNEMNAKEQKELAELLEAWLGGYTEEVISRIMEQIDEIVENPARISAIMAAFLL